MITRKQYREQMEQEDNLATTREEALEKSHKEILHTAEFDLLTISEQVEYALKQTRKGMNVTVEGDTSYDKTPRNQAKVQATEKDQVIEKKVTQSSLVQFLGKVAAVDLVAGLCGLKR